MDKKKLKTHLITSVQNIHWHNDNSLLFLKNNFFLSSEKRTPFFIFYDFDWLHIFELLEMAFFWQKKIILLEKNFFFLLKKIIPSTSRLKENIHWLETTNNESTFNVSSIIYLFVISPQQNDLSFVLNNYLKLFSPERKKNFCFTVGLPSTIGGEEKLASFFDFLFQESNQIINLNKNKKLNLGINFFDLNILIKLLNPNDIIIFNNSYKHKEILRFLPKKIIFLENNHGLDVSNNNVSFSLKNKKTVIKLEEILIKQRNKLKESGFLFVCVVAKKTETEIELKKIHLEKIAVPTISKEDNKKIREKMIKWWKEKLTSEVKLSDPIITIKKTLEKKINSFLRYFFNYRYNKLPEEITEISILIFLN